MKMRVQNSINALARRWGLLRRSMNILRMMWWQSAGKPTPAPHIVKERIVSGYASSFGVTTLIETGTFFGDMLYGVRDLFQVIISIELNPDFWRRAKERFRAYPHIEILQGDSGELLPKVLSNVTSRCLFWLDGHYSGGSTAKGHAETPIVPELDTIFRHNIKNHVILIDDARCFDGTHDYPKLEELREMVALNRPDYAFSVLNDVIRIHPQGNVQCDV